MEAAVHVAGPTPRLRRLPRSHRPSERLIDGIRDLSHRFPKLLVTGEAANIHDITRSIVGALPLAISFLVMATGIALFVQSAASSFP